MKSKVMVSLAVVLALGAAWAPSASARPKRHHQGPRVAPSVDADDLAALAPGALGTTQEQSYGDAAIARSRFQRYYQRQGITHDEIAADDSAYFCDRRVALASGYICTAAVPRQAGYGDYYGFTPAYVTAPQGSAIPTPLLSEVTSLFVGVNALRFDPHN